MSPNKKILNIILREIDDLNAAFNRFNCKSFEDFEKDTHLKKIIVMTLINISEAALSLPSSFRSKHGEIKWQQFKTLRNIGAHKYGSVNFIIVWNIVKNDIPGFKSSIQNLYDSIE